MNQPDLKYLLKTNSKHAAKQLHPETATKESVEQYFNNVIQMQQLLQATNGQMFWSLLNLKYAFYFGRFYRDPYEEL